MGFIKFRYFLVRDRSAPYCAAAKLIGVEARSEFPSFTEEGKLLVLEHWEYLAEKA